MVLLLELPPELLYHILGYVNPGDLPNIQRVCKTLKRAVKKNTLLYKQVYLAHLDTPDPDFLGPTGMDWEQDLNSIVRLHGICTQKNSDEKLQSLPVVGAMIRVLLLTRSAKGTWPESRNVALLMQLFCTWNQSRWFTQSKNQSIWFTQSFIYEYMRTMINGRSPKPILFSELCIPFPPPSRTIHVDTQFRMRQLSAELHVLHGLPCLHSRYHAVDNTYRIQSYAASIVYDIRKYDIAALRDLDDNNPYVDWEHLEAIMILIEDKFRMFTPREYTLLRRAPQGPFGGLFPHSWEGSGWPCPRPYRKGRDTKEEERDTKEEERERLAKLDPYGITGVWLRMNCFLPMRDYISHNSSEYASGSYVPRPPVTRPDYARLSLMRLFVKSVDMPEDGKGWPTVLFQGNCRMLDAPLHSNSVSRIFGFVRADSKGMIHWRTFDDHDDFESFMTYSVQIQEAKSSRGTLGFWRSQENTLDNDLDYELVGPTASWKISDGCQAPCGCFRYVCPEHDEAYNGYFLMPEDLRPRPDGPEPSPVPPPPPVGPYTYPQSRTQAPTYAHFYRHLQVLNKTPRAWVIPTTFPVLQLTQPSRWVFAIVTQPTPSVFKIPRPAEQHKQPVRPVRKPRLVLPPASPTQSAQVQPPAPTKASLPTSTQTVAQTISQLPTQSQNLNQAHAPKKPAGQLEPEEAARILMWIHDSTRAQEAQTAGLSSAAGPSHGHSQGSGLGGSGSIGVSTPAQTQLAPPMPRPAQTPLASQMQSVANMGPGPQLNPFLRIRLENTMRAFMQAQQAPSFAELAGPVHASSRLGIQTQLAPQMQPVANMGPGLLPKPWVFYPRSLGDAMRRFMLAEQAPSPAGLGGSINSSSRLGIQTQSAPPIPQPAQTPSAPQMQAVANMRPGLQPRSWVWIHMSLEDAMRAFMQAEQAPLPSGLVDSAVNASSRPGAHAQRPGLGSLGSVGVSTPAQTQSAPQIAPVADMGQGLQLDPQAIIRLRLENTMREFLQSEQAPWPARLSGSSVSSSSRPGAQAPSPGLGGLVGTSALSQMQAPPPQVPAPTSLPQAHAQPLPKQPVPTQTPSSSQKQPPAHKAPVQAQKAPAPAGLSGTNGLSSGHSQASGLQGSVSASAPRPAQLPAPTQTPSLSYKAPVQAQQAPAPARPGEAAKKSHAPTQESGQGTSASKSEAANKNSPFGLQAQNQMSAPPTQKLPAPTYVPILPPTQTSHKAPAQAQKALAPARPNGAAMKSQAPTQKSGPGASVNKPEPEPKKSPFGMLARRQMSAPPSQQPLIQPPAHCPPRPTFTEPACTQQPVLQIDPETRARLIREMSVPLRAQQVPPPRPSSPQYNSSHREAHLRMFPRTTTPALAPMTGSGFGPGARVAGSNSDTGDKENEHDGHEHFSVPGAWRS